MLARLAIYFSAWLLLVPWMAAWCWLTIDRLTAPSDYTFWTAAGDGAFGACFGVAFSLVFTVPMSAAVMFANSLLPQFRNAAIWRWALGISLGCLGLAWSVYQVHANGFQNHLWLAALLGLLAGAVLARVSHALLSTRLNKPAPRA